MVRSASVPDRAGTMTSPETLLASIDAASARQWFAVGKLLALIEAESRVAPDGRPWADHLQDRLSELGASRSPGHIRKIRTACQFLKQGGVAEADWDRVLLTSVDLAQRIAALDPQREAEVRRMCLDGASPTDLQVLYDRVRDEKTRQLSPRQLAWDRRRKVGIRTDERMVREDRLASSLASDAERWWGGGGKLTTISISRQRPYLRDMLPIVIMTHPGRRRVTGAYRVHRLETGEHPELQRIFETTLFQASFVDRYWLVLDGPPDKAKALWRQLVELGADNVGLRQVDLSCSEEVTDIGLGTGAPTPDRRDHLLGLLIDRLAGA